MWGLIQFGGWARDKNFRKWTLRCVLMDGFSLVKGTAWLVQNRASCELGYEMPAERLRPRQGAYPRWVYKP